MEIIYNAGTYLSTTFRRDISGMGRAAGSAGDGLLNAAQGDRVEISQQGRILQRVISGAGSGVRQDAGEEAAYGREKSRLMSHIDGDEAREDTRLAYNGPGSAADKGAGEDDTAVRIRELQTQLREAMKRLQQAREELGNAQAKRIEEVKALQNDENLESASVDEQQIEQECNMAKQKLVAAQAEVNGIQEQLQKVLHELNKKAKTMQGAGLSGAVGSTWEPEGTNDYIRGDW